MSFAITDLPAVNATLNAASAVLLCAAWWQIRRQNVVAHRRLMLAALWVSAAFLTSYLVYHFEVGSVRFQGTGAVRTLYFSILLTHTILAATLPVLVGITLVRALRSRFERHRAIARWTLPIWLYVSVTGVVVYWMLYQLDF